MSRYTVVQLNELAEIDCPCGTTRRAFVDEPERIASMHLVTTEGEAHTHYHNKLTELYLVIEGEGHLELDGEMVPVKPLSAVMIKPGCRHRAVGKMKFVNVPVPAFDPADMHFD